MDVINRISKELKKNLEYEVGIKDINGKLLELVRKNARKFINLIEDKKIKTIRVISHNDADGITSAAILIKVLKRLNLQYWLTNFKVFDLKAIEKVIKEDWDVAFILDFGLTNKKFEMFESVNKNIFVLDHHIIEEGIRKDILESKNNFNHVNLINAHVFGEKICAAAITYLFAKEVSEKNKDLAYLAIIGSVGDLCHIPNQILRDAIKSKKVIVKRGLKIFGASTKPIHKALAFSEIFLPESYGNEEEILELLKQANIKLIENGNYRTLLDLNEQEMKKLCTLIASRTGNEKLFGDVYLINPNGSLYDSKELAAILNSCGRLGHSEIGLEACYGKINRAEKIYEEYRKEIISALKWFEKARSDKNKVFESCNGKVLVIDAKNEIKDTIIGVFISILSSSNKNKVLIGLTNESDEKIKISARSSIINVKEFLDKLLEGMEVESGGHKEAAGAVIKKIDKGEFIKRIKSLLEC